MVCGAVTLPAFSTPPPPQSFCPPWGQPLVLSNLSNRFNFLNCASVTGHFELAGPYFDIARACTAQLSEQTHTVVLRARRSPNCALPTTSTVRPRSVPSSGMPQLWQELKKAPKVVSRGYSTLLWAGS